MSPTQPKGSAPKVSKSLREQLAILLTRKSRAMAQRFCLGAKGKKKEVILNLFLKEILSFPTVKFKHKTPLKNSEECSKRNREETGGSNKDIA